MPEDDISCLGHEFARRFRTIVRKDPPAAFLPLGRFAKGALDLMGMFTEIPMGDVMAGRPVGVGPPLGFDIVEIGGGPDHQHRLTSLSGVAVEMSRFWHGPLLLFLRPTHQHAASTPAEVATSDLFHDALQLGQITEDRIGLEPLDPIGPLVGFVDRTVEVLPELFLPLPHHVRFDKPGENEVPLVLEGVDLILVEHGCASVPFLGVALRSNPWASLRDYLPARHLQICSKTPNLPIMRPLHTVLIQVSTRDKPIE